MMLRDINAIWKFFTLRGIVAIEIVRVKFD